MCRWVMKASKFHFTNYSNALFFALCIALLVIINSGLSLVLQHQNEQVGLKLAKQLQQPLANEKQLKPLLIITSKAIHRAKNKAFE